MHTHTQRNTHIPYTHTEMEGERGTEREEKESHIQCLGVRVRERGGEKEERVKGGGRGAHRVGGEGQGEKTEKGERINYQAFEE